MNGRVDYSTDSTEEFTFAYTNSGINYVKKCYFQKNICEMEELLNSNATL